LNKIRHYFSTITVIRGLLIALLSSAFIYLNHWGISHPLPHTILALSSLFLLLQSEQKIWFWYGSFIGILWFWWIALSLQHYGYAWGFPVGVFLIAFIYGIIFLLIALISEKIRHLSTLPSVFVKAFFLLVFSYFHPFGFDWLKPELMFIESYIGIEKWQFALVLLSITLSIWKKNILFLFLVLFAYQSTQVAHTNDTTEQNKIEIITTHTSVKNKWDKSLHEEQFKKVFHSIDQAIEDNKTLVILPESVFPVFLNRNQVLIDTLQEKAKHISIVTGALYWDGKTPRNSTYIFTNGKITVANKVILVPFGESNPLPDFLSDWVNKVFYDGAIDYEASSDVIDYQINGTTYRNAICFEATSEKLYAKNSDGTRPKNMIVLSNNGWFSPSIEPSLQKLLLQYYAKKYGTTIYHAVNMSDSYIID
jgi:apolipoprotein N-acyltransferase